MIRDENIAPAPTLMQRCLAEFLGTAFLIFVGCGTLTASGFLGHTSSTFTPSDLLTVALGFGLAISIMVYAIGHISGCNINPAVSLALACVRKLTWAEAGAYVVAQLLGGFVGALLLSIVFGRSAASVLGYGATDYNPALVNYFTAIIAEAIGTFFLLFVVMGTVIDKRAPAGWAGFSVGLTVTMGILVLGVVTGGNFNPARAFGPTVVQMMFGGIYPFWHMFVYFIGPAIGAVAGVFTYSYLARARALRSATYRGYETGD
ncbi:MAG TPA: aquaporin [Ktedonobacteraceae bacterium]|nr:aquaporin [Ktedonobacteraceae bacterium]